MFYFKCLSPGLFEGIDMFAANKGGLRNYLSNSGVNFRFNAQVLSVQINKRYFHECSVIGRRKRAGFPA